MGKKHRVYIKYHFWAEKATAISFSMQFFYRFRSRWQGDVRSVTYGTKENHAGEGLDELPALARIRLY